MSFSSQKILVGLNRLNSGRGFISATGPASGLFTSNGNGRSNQNVRTMPTDAIRLSFQENPPKDKITIASSENTFVETITIESTENTFVGETPAIELCVDGTEDSNLVLLHKNEIGVSDTLIAIEKIDDFGLDQTVEYVDSASLEPLHPDGEEDSSIEMINATDSTPSKKSRKVDCPWHKCGKSFSTQNHMKVHYRKHTGEKPYVCTFEGCSKTFATGYSFKAHSRVHTGERPYNCSHDGCEKKFKTSSDLKKHSRVHTGEKPFLCNICGAAFTTTNIRKVHMRTHTKERPYCCDKCQKTFASQTNLQNHRRIHLGEKPFGCNVLGCGKSFTEYSSLYKHRTVHCEKPNFACSCGKSYRMLVTLEKHRRTCHQEMDASRIGDVCLSSDVNSCLVVITDDLISDDAINLAEIVIDNNDKEELATIMDEEDINVKQDQSNFDVPTSAEI